MFYTTDTNQHGLPHDPFKAIVAPRPIGWIGSKGRDGSLNLSPYSFFNAISDRPKLVMFSSSGRKDSLRNVEETGVFTANLVSRHLVDRMNASSAPLVMMSMSSPLPVSPLSTGGWWMRLSWARRWRFWSAA